MRTENRWKLMVGGVGLAWALLAAGTSSAQNFNAELWEFTGGNAAERNVYKCTACTFEQVLAVPLPGDNWDKNVSEGNRRFFFPEAANVPPVAPPGTPFSLDLVPEIEGDDHFLIARVLSGSLLGFGAQGAMALGRVERGTTMTYSAGQVLHKVASPDGVGYVMFSMSEERTTMFDPFVLNGLAGMSVPAGWAYSSEVAAEHLIVGTPGGVASVFSVSDYWNFQEIIVVPEPSTGLLGYVALGVTVPLARPSRAPRRDLT
jgi:hypothetical protein